MTGEKGTHSKRDTRDFFSSRDFQNTRVMLLDFTKFIEILISLVRGVGGHKTLRVF